MAEININFKDIVWTDVPDEVKKAFDFSLYNVEVKDGVAYVKKKEPDYPKTYKDCFYKVFENEENRYIHRSKLVMYDFTSSAKTISSGIPVLTEFEHLYKLLICRQAYLEEHGYKEDKSNWPVSDVEYSIGYISYTNEVGKIDAGLDDTPYVFSFPEKEMRDKFFDNFKVQLNKAKRWIR